MQTKLLHIGHVDITRAQWSCRQNSCTDVMQTKLTDKGYKCKSPAEVMQTEDSFRAG
jgi:hypothetical protein